jgi:hypothetical protein
MTTTAITAIYADSITEEGKRSYYFTKRMIMLKLGNTVGPIVSVIMFALLGNQWRVEDCCVVMIAGQILSIPPMMLLCWIKEEEEEEDDEEEENEEE